MQHLNPDLLFMAALAQGQAARILREDGAVPVLDGRIPDDDWYEEPTPRLSPLPPSADGHDC